jgi:molybdenum cofactor cytidylyltransferase
MGRASSLCGVILAAGASTRMGRDKALLPWPLQAQAVNLLSDTFLSAAIRSLTPITELVIVVAGQNAANLTPVVDAIGATLVINPDPSRGQFSSMQVGLQEVLSHGRDGAIVTLVDRPPATPETVDLLRRTFLDTPAHVWAVVPEFNGKHGHPFVVGRELIELFLKAPATANARDIEHQHQSHIEYLPVEDPFVIANVDTPEDYSALEKQKLKAP